MVNRSVSFGRHMFSSLEVPNYRLFFFGQLASVMGNWMQTVAEMWLIVKLTGSGAAVGLTALVRPDTDEPRPETGRGAGRLVDEEALIERANLRDHPHALALEVGAPESCHTAHLVVGLLMICRSNESGTI